jgi:hypothetical protein
LDVISYSGKPNPARPFAVAATVLLPLSLVPFCWRLALIPQGAASRRFVAGAGSLSMLLAALIFTRFHDLLINIAAPLGGVAFAVALQSLLRAGHRGLVLLALVALSLAAANWLMWETGALLRYMPLVQKLAYAALLTWVVTTVLFTGPSLRRRSASEAGAVTAP